MKGAEKTIEKFFIPDFVTSPKFNADPRKAENLMQIRSDSRGQPVKRTLIGGP